MFTKVQVSSIVEEKKKNQKIVEFIALPFPFSSKLKIWSFHVVVVQGQLSMDKYDKNNVTTVSTVRADLKIYLTIGRAAN